MHKCLPERNGVHMNFIPQKLEVKGKTTTRHRCLHRWDRVSHGRTSFGRYRGQWSKLCLSGLNNVAVRQRISSLCIYCYRLTLTQKKKMRLCQNKSTPPHWLTSQITFIHKQKVEEARVSFINMHLFAYIKLNPGIK